MTQEQAKNIIRKNSHLIRVISNSKDRSRKSDFELRVTKSGNTFILNDFGEDGFDVYKRCKENDTKAALAHVFSDDELKELQD